jgi:hypothetical protein
MTKLGRLLEKYYRANCDRHNLYVRRSKAKRNKKKWTVYDEAALVNARILKMEVRKELSAYLKQSGLCIVWGDMNQIRSLDLKRRRDAQKKSDRKWKLRAVEHDKKINMVVSLSRLDLYEGDIDVQF